MSNDFDWVTARHNCSIVSVFKSLEVAAEENVRTRNSLKSQNDHFRFTFQPQQSESFFVQRQTSNSILYIVFNLRDSFISVCNKSGKELFRAIPTLNNDRECRLKVNGEELEIWQVLRKALESLFFEID